MCVIQLFLVLIPIRLVVGVLAFLICFVSYLLRANISIGVLAMVQKNADDPDVSFFYTSFCTLFQFHKTKILVRTALQLVRGGYIYGSWCVLCRFMCHHIPGWFSCRMVNISTKSISNRKKEYIWLSI